MKAEQVADLIEKLIEAKLSLDSMARSKTVADANRQFLMDASKQNIARFKAELIQALKSGAG
jgi:hypothetical protein